MPQPFAAGGIGLPDLPDKSGKTCIPQTYYSGDLVIEISQSQMFADPAFRIRCFLYTFVL